MSGTDSASIQRSHDAFSGGSAANTSSEDVTSIPHQEPESSYNEEEDDPLGVKKLALSFDYLLYKISESIDGLAQQTELSVLGKKDEVEKHLIDVEASMDNLKSLIQKCDELDNDFSMIEQINYIVNDFKHRIADLERKTIQK